MNAYKICCKHLTAYLLFLLNPSSTHTHTYCREGFSTCLAQGGSGCTMRDLLTPLHPCKTYQMAQNGGPFWLPCSPDFQVRRFPKVNPSSFSLPCSLTPCTHWWSLLNISPTPTYTHIHAEVKSPPPAARGLGGESGRDRKRRHEGWERCLFLLGPCAYKLEYR